MQDHKNPQGRGRWPKGAAVALYCGDPYHVFEPCGCGYTSCQAVMVACVGDADCKPWPLYIERLVPLTKLARELMDLAR